MGKVDPDKDWTQQPPLVYIVCSDGDNGLVHVVYVNGRQELIGPQTQVMEYRGNVTLDDLNKILFGKRGKCRLNQ